MMLKLNFLSNLMLTALALLLDALRFIRVSLRPQAGYSPQKP